MLNKGRVKKKIILMENSSKWVPPLAPPPPCSWKIIEVFHKIFFTIVTNSLTQSHIFSLSSKADVSNNAYISSIAGITNIAGISNEMI